MNPTVYLYSETEKGFELYLGGYSILQGLRVFDKAATMAITSFGATLYKAHGWATESELPPLESVGSVITFLESEGDIGIIEFEASLPGMGTFGSHDDAECHYVLNSRHQCISILKSVAPPQYSDKLINALVSHPEIYITCSEAGILSKYWSFDEYIRNGKYAKK